MTTSRALGITGLVSVPGFYTSARLQKGAFRQVGEHPLARRHCGAAAHAGDEPRAVHQLEPDLRVVAEVHDTADARRYRVRADGAEGDALGADQQAHRFPWVQDPVQPHGDPRAADLDEIAGRRAGRECARGADEVGDEGRGRTLVDVPGRAELLDAPV